jgi:predicted dehydrogenase
LQAVIVATPDFWHAPITNACLKAGLHVYCEKMMSNTIEGARSMVQTMRRRQSLLQIGHQRRSNPRYLFALNRLWRGENLRPADGGAGAMEPRGHGRFWLAQTFGHAGPRQLAKYGFKDMHQFRNWRWFKGLGGGPLSDLGAHQIDIFNWWFGVTPRSVMASGGVDYYTNHEWYDNAMVIYEYPLPEGVARAFYQVQTTTSAGGGYFEMFMGDEGTIKMSEDPKLCAIYREARAPSWDDLIAKNFLRASGTPRRRRRQGGRARNRAARGNTTFRCVQQAAAPAASGKLFQRHPRHGEIELPGRRGVPQRIRHPQGQRSHRRAKTHRHHAAGSRS